MRTGQPLVGIRVWTESRRRQDLGPPSILVRAPQSQAALFIGMWYLGLFITECILFSVLGILAWKRHFNCIGMG